MLRASPKIGRPGPGIKKISGLYRLSVTGINVNTSDIELLSSITFGNPVVQLSGGVAYKMVFNSTYTATYVSPTPTENRWRLASGGSVMGNLLNVSKNHTAAGACGSGLPSLAISSIFTGSTSGYSSNRFRCRRTVSGGTGRTQCSKSGSIELLFVLSGASIVNTNLDKTSQGFGVFTLEEL